MWSKSKTHYISLYLLLKKQLMKPPIIDRVIPAIQLVTTLTVQSNKTHIRCNEMSINSQWKQEKNMISSRRTEFSFHFHPTCSEAINGFPHAILLLSLLSCFVNKGNETEELTRWTHLIPLFWPESTVHYTVYYSTWSFSNSFSFGHVTWNENP